MCWVFVLAALLLKQIPLMCTLEPMFQHDLGISVRCWIRCSNILTRFSVSWFMPICTRALYRLRKQYFLILLIKQRAYLYRISCGIFLKLLLYFKKYLLLFWTILKMFWHFRTFHICFWIPFCRLAEPICFVLKPN